MSSSRTEKHYTCGDPTCELSPHLHRIQIEAQHTAGQASPGARNLTIETWLRARQEFAMMRADNCARLKDIVQGLKELLVWEPNAPKQE